jgi:transglutaminase superfamily protein
MWRLEQSLPERMNLPLPEMMNALTPPAPDLPISPESVRRFVDAITAFDIRSPLGICLRRSLVRYHFLRRAGLDVVILFGARFKDSLHHELGGHAWLVLDNQPYAEESENYIGFATLYRYPHADQIQGEGNDLLGKSSRLH